MKKFIATLIASVNLNSISAYAQDSDFKIVESNGIKFSYKIDGPNLVAEVSCATDGWVAVGFDPDMKMMGSNIIIGYVDAKGVSVRDDYGHKPGGHVSDVSLGGTDNLTAISGEELNGVTTIRFTIPTDSKDQFDRPLAAGSAHKVMLACGKAGSDNFVSMHKAVALVNLNL